ncbi:MAG: type II toxin-antitoxin system RelE/ParE family toxin, partial [candidate division Zixibacteria bacterium]|nr:type II toxin-antitoxin system RelE/ParE family toxin [candidate division Zixibacteria bacterium]
MKYELRSTKQYDKWLAGIKDRQARNRILRRIDSMVIGSFGDHKTISANLFELRMFFSPGFRVYYTIQGREIIFLLAGGDKSSQKKDIAKARELLQQLEIYKLWPLKQNLLMWLNIWKPRKISRHS